jgi:hypothetical protein
VGGLEACQDWTPRMDTNMFALASTTGAPLASLRSVYLQRLQRLRRLRHQHEQELNRQGLRLLDRSAFAAYCACREVGAEDEARKILREKQSALQQLDSEDAAPERPLESWSPDTDAA